jgi:hypothetical protein
MRFARARSVLAALPAVGVAAAHAVASVACRASGYSVISDDDFARVVIAQAFAQAPRLDPSGTSWLPFPFWAHGGAMLVAGSSLGVARAFSTALAAASGALLFAAGRALRLPPAWAALGALMPLSLPLVPLLCAATVPELPTAALTVFAVCAATGRGRLALAGSLAALAASLSRYEAWPVALLLAAVLAARAARAPEVRRPLAAGALLCAAGPLLWCVWNIHAHGDALQFVHRVASYGAALGDRAASAASYPLALAREAPGLIVAALVAVVVRAWAAGRGGPGPRSPWAGGAPAWLLLAAVAAQVGALSIAAARGGSPTHHPERAVVACWMLLWLLVVDGLALAAASRRGAAGVAAGAVVALSLAWGAARAPGVVAGLGPQRKAELALGEALGARVAPGDRIAVFPDGYGFFATAAALDRPGELVALVPRSVDPRSPVGGDPTASVEELRAACSGAAARHAVLTSAQWRRLEPPLPATPLPGGYLVDLGQPR